MLKKMESVKMSGIFYSLVIFFISGCIANQTDDIKLHVSPHEMAVEPGSDISIKCNSSLAIHRFYWSIRGKIVDMKFVQKLDDHSMILNLKNVGLDPTYDFRQSTDVVCTDNYYSNGCTVDVGYGPVAPEVQCLMQNLNDLHCRWSYLDKRTESHLNWQHETTSTTTYKSSGWSPTSTGLCKESTDVKKSNFHGSCVVRTKDDLRYWKNMEIEVVISNVMGENSSVLVFTPEDNVMLSPPIMNTSITRQGNVGGTVQIEAVYSSSPETHEYLHRYCAKCYRLQVSYKEIQDDVDEKSIKQYDEKIFWQQWSQNTSEDDHLNRNLMNRSSFISVDAQKLSIHNLPANTRYIFQARWKVGGEDFSGVWSLSTFFVTRTNNLEPPAFFQSALLFFNYNSCSSLSCNYPDESQTTNHQFRPILFWKHSERGEIIHEKNIYHYQSTTEKHNISKLSTSLPLFINSTSEIKISAVNDLGTTSSPLFTISLDSSCHLEIVSLTLKNNLGKVLIFQIVWVYFSTNSSIECNLKDIEESLKVSVFSWQEKSAKNKKKSFIGSSEIPSYVKLNTFYIEINSTKLPNSKKRREVEFHVQDVRHTNSTLQFSSYFQPFTAYRIAVALSSSVGNKISQGPASLNSNLYYYSIQKPVGTPSSINCTEIRQTSMIVTWSSVKPEERAGPILGYYVLYYTTNKNCLSGHQSISCHSPYDTFHENCNRSHAHVETIWINEHATKDRTTSDGWHIESTDNNNAMSFTLTNLLPGSQYYIGIAAFNKKGISKCFHHVIQDTDKARHTTWKPFVIILTIIGFLVVGICIMHRFRKSIWQCLHRPMTSAEEVFRIPLNTDNEGEVDELDATVTTIDTGDPYDCFHANDNNVDEIAIIKTQLAMEEHQNINNNASHALLQDHNCTELKKSCNNVNGMPAYLQSTPPRHDSGSTNQDTSSLASDVPGCSQSSTTASTSRPSTSCCDDSDNSSISSTEDKYTSLQRALYISGRTRCCVRI
ncbi:uncharacterized protein LOC120342197 [Styela clava]